MNLYVELAKARGVKDPKHFNHLMPRREQALNRKDGTSTTGLKDGRRYNLKGTRALYHV